MAPRSVEEIGALNRKYTTDLERAEARRASARRSAAKLKADPDRRARRDAWRQQYRQRPEILAKTRREARERMRALRAAERHECRRGVPSDPPAEG